ncbi:MAG: hypothetical protein R3249_02520 [Nitriliruptorales bacterium]|nr:hypothetical protein [Nitriliruptorales bacterium]
MRARLTAALGALGLLLAACSQPSARTFDALEPAERGPTVVVSFPLLADVVGQILDGHGVVTVVHPEGEATPLADDQQATIRAADVVLVHGREDEETILLAARASPDADPPPRVERVDTLLDPPPASTATWFDPIDTARIALALGAVLAEVDEAGLRTADEWFESAESVATEIASTYDEATRRLAAIPTGCRHASGDAAMLEVLALRFEVRPAEPGRGEVADLASVETRLEADQDWQEWFLGIIDRVAALDPDCDRPASPSPTPSPTATD